MQEPRMCQAKILLNTVSSCVIMNRIVHVRTQYKYMQTMDRLMLIEACMDNSNR